MDFHRKILNYLRRLTAALDNRDNIIGAGAVEPYAAHISGNISLGTDWTTIDFDQTIHVNPLYRKVGAQIFVKEAGLYAVHFTLDLTGANGSDDIDSRVALASFGLLSYGFTTNTERTHVVSLPVPMKPDYPLVIQGRRTAGPTTVAAGGTRFMMYRISRVTDNDADVGDPPNIKPPPSEARATDPPDIIWQE